MGSATREWGLDTRGHYLNVAGQRMVRCMYMHVVRTVPSGEFSQYGIKTPPCTSVPMSPKVEPAGKQTAAHRICPRQWTLELADDVVMFAVRGGLLLVDGFGQALSDDAGSR